MLGLNPQSLDIERNSMKDIMNLVSEYLQLFLKLKSTHQSISIWQIINLNLNKKKLKIKRVNLANDHEPQITFPQPSTLFPLPYIRLLWLFLVRQLTFPLIIFYFPQILLFTPIISFYFSPIFLPDVIVLYCLDKLDLFYITLGVRLYQYGVYYLMGLLREGKRSSISGYCLDQIYYFVYYSQTFLKMLFEVQPILLDLSLEWDWTNFDYSLLDELLGSLLAYSSFFDQFQSNAGKKEEAIVPSQCITVTLRNFLPLNSTIPTAVARESNKQNKSSLFSINVQIFQLNSHRSNSKFSNFKIQNLNYYFKIFQ